MHQYVVVLAEPKSQPSGLDGKIFSIAKRTHSAEKYLTITGLKANLMKTSRQLTLDFGEEKSTYLQPDFPVNRFPQPESEKARKMTDISGRTSLEQFGRFNRATSWAKTFAGLLIGGGGGMVFDQVQSDLENEGYEVLPFLLPACGVNAPHRRDRIWIVAHAYDKRGSGGFGEVSKENGEVPQWDKDAQFGNADKWDATDTDQFNGNISRLRTGEISQQQTSEVRGNNASNADSQQRSEGRMHQEGSETAERYSGSCDSWSNGNAWQNFPTESGVCQGNDGFSSAVDLDSIFKQLGIEHPRQPAIGYGKWKNESIKGYGNAWVPQVAYEIFKAINQYELLIKK